MQAYQILKKVMFSTLLIFAAQTIRAYDPSGPNCEARGDYQKCAFADEEIRYCIPVMDPLRCTHMGTPSNPQPGDCYQYTEATGKVVYRIDNKKQKVKCPSITLEDLNPANRKCRVTIARKNCPFLKRALIDDGVSSKLIVKNFERPVGKSKVTVIQNGFAWKKGYLSIDGNTTDPNSTNIVINDDSSFTSNPVLYPNGYINMKTNFPYIYSAIADRDAILTVDKEMPVDFTEKKESFTFNDTNSCRVIAITKGPTTVEAEEDYVDKYQTDLAGNFLKDPAGNLIPETKRPFLLKTSVSTSSQGEACCTGEGLPSNSNVESRSEYWTRFCHAQEWEFGFAGETWNKEIDHVEIITPTSATKTIVTHYKTLNLGEVEHGITGDTGFHRILVPKDTVVANRSTKEDKCDKAKTKKDKDDDDPKKPHTKIRVEWK